MAKDEAIGQYHEHQRKFTDKLAEKYASKQIAAINEAQKLLKQAGFPVSAKFWCQIITNAGKPYLECHIIGSIRADTKPAFALSNEDVIEYKRNKEEADVFFSKYLQLTSEYDEALAAELEAHKPTDFDGILALVKDGFDEHEQYYIDHCPRKNEQEGYTGVQVVEMNVNLLVSWLDDSGDDFESLSIEQRRKIWKESGFHFGIVGYTDADEDYWWEHEAN